MGKGIDVMREYRKHTCSIGWPRRLCIAVIVLLMTMGVSVAVEQALDQAVKLRNLERTVLNNPFDLEKLERLGQLRKADRSSYIKAFNALADGLEAVLKDDHESAAAQLKVARGVPQVRELARTELGDALWRMLAGDDASGRADVTVDEDGEGASGQGRGNGALSKLQNLCPACGHTGLMDCQRCRGDGYYRGETCPQCEGAGVEACTHSIHEEAAERGLSNEQRSRVRRLIAMARYLSAGGVDWFSDDAQARSPRIGDGRD